MAIFSQAGSRRSWLKGAASWLVAGFVAWGAAGCASLSGTDPLPSWADGPARQAIIDFVNDVTNEASPNYVPPAQRIATFDNDGTLWVEQPMYTQFAFMIDQVKAAAPRNPQWQDNPVYKALAANDLKGALAVGVFNVILVFFLVELFDATGTLMAVAKRAGLLSEENMGRMNKALLADSGAIFAGSLLGTSSTTAYLESASGVQAGGRTGLTAVTVAVLFLACLFISPLAGAVPAYATAPALFFVACLMLRELTELNWDETTEVVPATVTALAMPLTYSIANGLAFGFIAHAALKAGTGRWREVHPALWLVAGLFVLRYALA